MCEGEFESLKAIDAVSPGFVPKPHAWGKAAKQDDTYFLLVEFREIGRQVCRRSLPLSENMLAEMIKTARRTDEAGSQACRSS